MTIPIVVVDDEQVDRYIVRRLVKKAGIDGKVVEFQAGDEFLEVIMDQQRRTEEIGSAPPPMLVLLDINMPRISGFEVLEAIDEGFGDGGSDADCMIILMFSSSNHAEDKQEAFSYSFVKDYIIKPITVPVLQRIVDQYYEEN